MPKTKLATKTIIRSRKITAREAAADARARDFLERLRDAEHKIDELTKRNIELAGQIDHHAADMVTQTRAYAVLDKRVQKFDAMEEGLNVALSRVAELEGYIRAICDTNPAISCTIIQHGKKPISTHRVDDPSDGAFIRAESEEAWRSRR